MRRSSSSDSATPTLARSIACPPAMPSAPAARASRRHSRACMASGTSSSGVSSSKARACSASPASSAWACPNCTCTVGLPRRSTSLSMQGMSSCTSEYAWISSTEQAARRAAPAWPDTASAAASTSSGRSRFPAPSTA